MMAQMHSRFGGVDILVNNAGVQHVSPVHEFPEDKVSGPVTCCASCCVPGGCQGGTDNVCLDFWIHSINLFLLLLTNAPTRVHD